MNDRIATPDAAQRIDSLRAQMSRDGFAAVLIPPPIRICRNICRSTGKGVSGCRVSPVRSARWS